MNVYYCALALLVVLCGAIADGAPIGQPVTTSVGLFSSGTEVSSSSSSESADALFAGMYLAGSCALP